MHHRGKKNSDVATQALLIAECFKQAHAGKAGCGAHQTLARAISNPRRAVQHRGKGMD